MEKKCEVCVEAAAKYTCPGCGKRTCSLPCVRKHKSDTGCTGVRDKTRFVAVKEFDDLHLLSDYRFLEDVGRTADSANRDNYENRKRSNNARTKLTRECKKRDVTLLTMPFTMSRRRKNHSRHLWQEDCVLWTIEWIFPQSDATYTTSTKESCTLKENLAQFIDPTESDPVMRHKLKTYVDRYKDVTVLMKVEGRRADSVRYYKLNGDMTWRENLTGKTIIENPTVHVVLSESLGDYPLIQPGEETEMESLKDLVPSGNLDPSVYSQRGKRSHGNRGRHHHGNRGRGGKAPKYSNGQTNACPNG